MKLGCTRAIIPLQCKRGCSHIVAHLVDYFCGGESNPPDNQPTGAKSSPWGIAGDPSRLWTVAKLVELKSQIEQAGLHLETTILAKQKL